MALIHGLSWSLTQRKLGDFLALTLVPSRSSLRSSSSRLLMAASSTDLPLLPLAPSTAHAVVSTPTIRGQFLIKNRASHGVETPKIPFSGQDQRVAFTRRNIENSFNKAGGEFIFAAALLANYAGASRGNAADFQGLILGATWTGRLAGPSRKRNIDSRNDARTILLVKLNIDGLTLQVPKWWK